MTWNSRGRSGRWAWLVLHTSLPRRCQETNHVTSASLFRTSRSSKSTSSANTVPGLIADVVTGKLDVRSAVPELPGDDAHEAPRNWPKYTVEQEVTV